MTRTGTYAGTHAGKRASNYVPLIDMALKQKAH